MNPPFIYLDNNATTPVDPRVLEAMLPYFTAIPGNAASRNHPYGWKAKEAVDVARQQIADLLSIEGKELVFTSGATEAINLAIKGIYESYSRKGKHIITLQTEHKAVLDTCKRLEKIGAEVTYLPVQEDGLLDVELLKARIRPDTILVSVLWANNETGVIQPMKDIGHICQEKGVFLMSDATQAVGKIPVSPKEVGVHLMAFSAHKMYGPKGMGALYVSQRQPKIKIAAQIDGGGHENGMRSGTLNVPSIVGFGKAAMIAKTEMQRDAERLQDLRDQFEAKMLNGLEEVKINGEPNIRLPHVSNLSFRFIKGETLMARFSEKLGVSSGAACTSATLEPSHVLQAMGLNDYWTYGALRFSLGRFTKVEEVERASKIVIEGVQHLRKLSPIWELFKDGVAVDDL
ncbi:MAG: aminotransferase class V-fold PLP-dependent enzyme [Saprospiraceae bacterium]|nr:aminotransferase class V-fold PLP-dependent enzyme [Saprospiraceae bacterium]